MLNLDEILIKQLTHSIGQTYHTRIMTKKLVKLSEVAENAGVSIATASMALTGKGRISSDVREKVKLTAQKLGYNRKNNTPASYWGILLPMEDFWDNVWHFMKPALTNILTAAGKSGIQCSIIPIYTTSDTGGIYTAVKSHNVSSVFSIHFGKADLFRTLEENNIRVVVINNSNFQDGYYSVCVDDFQGAYEGTRYLIEKNHREIAFIDYPITELPSLLSDRYFGFRKAMEETRITIPESRHLTVELNDIPGIKKGLQELIRQTPPPTAFFIHDDILANRVIHILGELGKKVPEDFSIVAPGDTLNYSYPEIPQITTMSIDTGLMGKYAAEMMLERTKGTYAKSHVLKIKQQLIQRGTCKYI